jgi:hypothetical protein
MWRTDCKFRGRRGRRAKKKVKQFLKFYGGEGRGSGRERDKKMVSRAVIVCTKKTWGSFLRRVNALLPHFVRETFSLENLSSSSYSNAFYLSRSLLFSSNFLRVTTS